MRSAVSAKERDASISILSNIGRCGVCYAMLCCEYAVLESGVGELLSHSGRGEGCLSIRLFSQQVGIACREMMG
jgi:hypothetical protein